MNPNNLPSDDRETLCALFDGELQGDAARFALKRLGHDAQWRQACGRWQLYGDVLRGQATAVASGGFADRVALAIAQEPALEVAEMPAANRSATTARRAHRGWMGGALAASVAVAALFVTRPFSDDATTTRSAPPSQVASSSRPAAAVVQQPIRPAATARTPVSPQVPTQTAGLAAAAVAAVEVPRRAVERRSSRGQSQRAALRANRQVAVATAVASASPAAAPALGGSDMVAASAGKPFQPQHTEAVSRPWPRAVLPQYSTGGAITAGFGNSAASSPSFYPFEPNLSQPEAADAGAESSGPRR